MELKHTLSDSLPSISAKYRSSVTRSSARQHKRVRTGRWLPTTHDRQPRTICHHFQEKHAPFCIILHWDGTSKRTSQTELAQPVRPKHVYGTDLVFAGDQEVPSHDIQQQSTGTPHARGYRVQVIACLDTSSTARDGSGCTLAVGKHGIAPRA